VAPGHSLGACIKIGDDADCRARSSVCPGFAGRRREIPCCRLPDGFVRSGCGGRPAWGLKARPRVYECGTCHRQESVTAGTVFPATGAVDINGWGGGLGLGLRLGWGLGYPYDWSYYPPDYGYYGYSQPYSASQYWYSTVCDLESARSHRP
jgi:hypothetical protein